MPNPYYDLWDAVADDAQGDKKSSESDPAIPDGDHRARVVAFDCFESKTGDLWLKMTFGVLGGVFDGRPLVRMIAPLGRRQDDEDYRRKQIGWAKKDLRTLLGEVPQIVGGLLDPETRRTGPVATQILGAVVMVRKQTKGDRINVYINELLSPGPSSRIGQDDSPAEAPQTPESPPHPADDDIPW